VTHHSSTIYKVTSDISAISRHGMAQVTHADLMTRENPKLSTLTSQMLLVFSGGAIIITRQISSSYMSH
jgi:hypothetical protein